MMQSTKHLSLLDQKSVKTAHSPTIHYANRFLLIVFGSRWKALKKQLLNFKKINIRPKDQSEFLQKAIMKLIH